MGGRSLACATCWTPRTSCTPTSFTRESSPRRASALLLALRRRAGGHTSTPGYDLLPHQGKACVSTQLHLARLNVLTQGRPPEPTSTFGFTVPCSGLDVQSLNLHLDSSDYIADTQPCGRLALRAMNPLGLVAAADLKSAKRPYGTPPYKSLPFLLGVCDLRTSTSVGGSKFSGADDLQGGVSCCTGRTCSTAKCRKVRRETYASPRALEPWRPAAESFVLLDFELLAA